MQLLKQNYNYIPNKLNSIKIINTNEELEDYIKKLYLKDDFKANNNEYISLLKLENRQAKRWSLDTSDAEKLHNFNGEKDFYLSVNSLYCAGKHTTKYIKSLNAVFVDLDYYNIDFLKDLDVLQVIGLLENELDYPTPSFYVDSGRGLYIMWLLETTYATNKSKSYWRKIEKTLIELFTEYGADAKVSDAARVLRMVGSVNSKSNRTVKIIESPNYINEDIPRYELGDIAEYLWGVRDLTDTTDKPKKKRKQTRKVIQLKNTYTLNCARVNDLEKLVSLRQGTNNKTGYREKLLFLYRLHLLYANNESGEVLDKTLELNNKLDIPLDEKEVIKATKNAEGVAETYHRLTGKYDIKMGISLNQHLSNGGAYMYQNRTIIKDLNITTDEQRYMSTLIGTEVKKERKQVRNQEYYNQNAEEIKKKYEDKRAAEGKLSRAEQNKLKREQIKLLMKQGKTQKEIATELEIGLRTVAKYSKEIKDTI